MTVATAPTPSTVVGRMKQALGVRSLSQLAEKLGANLSTVKGWSARDSVPLRWIARCELASGVSIHWIVLGEEPHHTDRRSVDAAREWFGPLLDQQPAGPVQAPSEQAATPPMQTRRAA